MEKYVKLEDVKALINKLFNEPPYQHTGETYYAGVAAVDMELSVLPTVDITEFCSHCGYKMKVKEN